MAVDHLKDLFGLAGKTALVTGASSGLSREAAHALAKAGAHVGLVARRKERLETLATELRETYGVGATAAPADVTSREQITAAFDRVEAELGPVDVLMHGAGVAPLGRAEAHAREKWDSAIAVNLTASFEVCQEAARRMIEGGRQGSLIVVTSVVGRGANSIHKTVGYAASKGGADNLVRHLAAEWATKGIRVNGLAPGYFPSEMTIDPRVGEVNDEARGKIEHFTPMARLGRDGELQTAVLFLAAPASSYVTGSIVAVDGGWTAW